MNLSDSESSQSSSSSSDSFTSSSSGSSSSSASTSSSSSSSSSICSQTSLERRFALEAKDKQNLKVIPQGNQVDETVSELDPSINKDVLIPENIIEGRKQNDGASDNSSEHSGSSGSGSSDQSDSDSSSTDDDHVSQSGSDIGSHSESATGSGSDEEDDFDSAVDHSSDSSASSSESISHRFRYAHRNNPIVASKSSLVGSYDNNNNNNNGGSNSSNINHCSGSQENLFTSLAKSPHALPGFKLHLGNGTSGATGASTDLALTLPNRHASVPAPDTRPIPSKNSFRHKSLVYKSDAAVETTPPEKSRNRRRGKYFISLFLFLFNIFIMINN